MLTSSADRVDLPKAGVRFTIRYIDPTREAVVEVQTEVSSESQLRQDFLAQGQVILSIVALPENVIGKNHRDFEVAWWCQELKTLLSAGMTVVEALESLLAQGGSGRRAEVQATLLRSLREGQALSKAMHGSGAFPEVLVASVTASERTSTLVSALDDYLRYEEVIRQLRRKAVSAAIYPAVVIGLGVVISLFLLLYVVPRFSRMYVDFRGEVSGITQGLIWFSRLLVNRSTEMFLGALLVSLLLMWTWLQGIPQKMTRRWLAGVGPLQRQLDHFRLAKLYQSLALMFRGGYTLDEALEVALGLDLGLRIEQGLRSARDGLARGRAVAAAFQAAGLTDAVTERLLSVGERSGSFDKVLQVIADRHAQSFGLFVERATRLLEPLLLLVVALVVGGIILMMYMPIFDIANGIR